MLAGKFALAVILSSLFAYEAHGDIVRILDNPQEALQARVDVIQQAKTSIDAQYYEVGDDNTSRIILSLLRQAAQGQTNREPVKVRLIIDSVTSHVNPVIAAALAEAHVEIRVYHPFSMLHLIRETKRMHDKDIVIDGTKILSGGRNIGDFYFKDSTIDRDIFAQGAVAHAAKDYFDALWNSKEVEPFKVATAPKHPKTLAECKKVLDKQDNERCVKQSKLSTDLAEAPGIMDKILTEGIPEFPVKFMTQTDWAKDQRDVPVEFLHDVPGMKVHGHGIYEKVIEQMKNADDNIAIEVPYFVPSEEMMEVFKELTNPNRPSRDPTRPPHAVKIRVLTNSLYVGKISMVAQMGYEALKEKLLAMHVDLWETKNNFIHAKSYAIDDKVSIIGSYNADARSEKLNTELALKIDDAQVNQELRASMEKHLAVADEMDSLGYPINDNHRYPKVSHRIIGELHLLRILLPILRNQL